MGKRAQLSEAERDQRREADRERLEEAARALLSSEGWQRWVRVRATNGLSRYSLNNQILIALQRPDASYVAGFRAFLDLGRCVRRGERAIRILAPVVRRRDEESPAEHDTTAESDRAVVGFRGVPVFDVSQTDLLPDRDPEPLTPPSQPIAGSSHAHIRDPLASFAKELGYTVDYRPLEGGADGWCDSKQQRIVVNEALAPNAQVRVLVHEIAHALGVDYKTYGRERAEVIVDCVTYIVCGSLGLDVGGESIPYVAGWGEAGALDAVREFASLIDDLARRIESPLLTAANLP